MNKSIKSYPVRSAAAVKHFPASCRKRNSHHTLGTTRIRSKCSMSSGCGSSVVVRIINLKVASISAMAMSFLFHPWEGDRTLISGTREHLKPSPSPLRIVSLKPQWIGFREKSTGNHRFSQKIWEILTGNHRFSREIHGQFMGLSCKKKPWTNWIGFILGDGT